MKHGIYIGLILSFLLLVGCNRHVGLSGKVVFSDDKSPLPFGTVGLLAESGAFSARGDIKPDGTFTSGSVKTNDGVPPSKYRVSVSALKEIEVVPAVGESSPEITYETLIDPKYGLPETSGITIDITSSMRNFIIEVDRYVPKAKR